MYNELHHIPATPGIREIALWAFLFQPGIKGIATVWSFLLPPGIRGIAAAWSFLLLPLHVEFLKIPPIMKREIFHLQPGRLCRLFAIIATITLFTSSMMATVIIPEMRWVLLPGGTNGSCVSNTDCCANTFCYGLEYTPGNSGHLTSYTTAFFVDCVMGGSPVLSNASCVMIDNSEIENGCVDFDLIRMHCSSNDGSIHVDAGIPVIIHQVCFSLPPGTTVSIAEDEVLDLTLSINLDGGGFATEYPEFETQTIAHSYIATNTNNNGVGSVRNVINCASTGSTIIFDSSLINQIISLTSGVININKDLTIQGPGMGALILSGNNSSGIFHVFPGYELTLKDIALKNATALTNGGAIFAEGNVTFQNVLLQNNFENGIPKSMTIGSTSLIEFLGTVNFKN